MDRGCVNDQETAGAEAEVKQVHIKIKAYIYNYLTRDMIKGDLPFRITFLKMMCILYI